MHAGADKSHCPMPGTSAFSDRASDISLGTCPLCHVLKVKVIFRTNFSHENALLNNSES